MSEYGFSLTRIIQYTGKFGSEKTCIIAYFKQCTTFGVERVLSRRI